MAVTYDDLFGFIGKWIKATNNAVSVYSTLTTDETALTSGNAFGDGTNYDIHVYSVHNVIDGLRSAISGYNNNISAQVKQILSNREDIIVELGLGTNPSFYTIINSLMNAMVADSESVASSTVTVGSVTRTVVNSTAGYAYCDKGLDGVTAPIAGGLAYDHYLGTDSQLAVSTDNITITCIQDSDSLGGVAGSEQWEIRGLPANNSSFGWLSEGSGLGPTATTIGTANSLFTNGDFETWTGTNVLSSWTYDAGAATTNFVKESTNKLLGTYGLKMIGNGGTTLTITQAAPTSLQVKKRYCVGLWLLGVGGNSGGTLTVQFTGTGYTAGSTEKITANSTALQGTSWTHYKFFFNVPTNIPSDFKIQINITSAFNGSVYLDDLTIGTPTYHGGVCYAVFQGAGKFLKNDKHTLTVSNNDNSAFNKYARKDLKLQFPSSGSPTQANSLTT